MRTHLAVIAAAAALAAAPSAALAAPSTTVVVNEVYGGGNAGATLTNDFVALANRGRAPVDVSGWSTSPSPTSSRSRRSRTTPARPTTAWSPHARRSRS